MSIEYSINPVEEKPKKNTKPQGSKYAPIIEAFLESDYKLVMVDETGLDAYYLAGQLKKVCKQLGKDSIKVSVRNKGVYLEK